MVRKWFGFSEWYLSNVGYINYNLYMLCIWFNCPLGRSVLMSTGFHWKIAYIELFSSAVGVCVGLFLMTYLQMGIIGMSLGIGLTLLLRGLIFYPRILAFYFETNSLDVFKYSISNSLAVFILLFIMLKALDSAIIFSISNLFYELFEFILLFITWCGLNYFFVLSKEHKWHIFNNIKQKDIFKHERNR